MIDSTDDLEIVFCNKPTLTHVIPDGGFGWLVVFAAFMNSALIDGMFYSFGIIRLVLMDYLPPMNSASFFVNLIGALQLSFPLLSGPLGSVLGKRFGFRSISMVGGFVSACSYLICFFAPPNIFIFYIFYGIIGGMGLGMIFMGGIITISQYFDKKRPLSTGIAVCGTGFGIFIMGSLMSLVISYYSWHGALFILAGISFQTILFSTFLKPLQPQEVDVKSLCHNSRITIGRKNSCSINLKSPAITSNAANLESTIFSREAIDTAIKSGFISSFLDLTTMMETMGAQIPENQDVMYVRSITNISCVPVPHDWDVVHITSNINNNDEEVFDIKMNRWKIFKYFYFQPVCFRNLQLFLYYLSALMFSCCYTLPFYYISSRLVDDYGFSGISSGIIVSIMGLSSLCCRMATGVLSTVLPNYKLWFYVGCLVICGLVNLISTFFGKIYSLWVIWGIIVGGGLGGIITLESVILAEMVPLDDMASAFGSYQLTCGLGTLLGPPIAGLLFDWLTSYSVIFIICGVMFILSGLVVIPIHWLPSR